MNIIVLMAGHGSEFDNKDNYPKPLIEVKGKLIVEHVLENITPLMKNGCSVFFLVKQSDCEQYYLDNTLKLLAPDSIVIPISGNTSGAAATALRAIGEVSDSEPLLLINGDQIIDVDLVSCVDQMTEFDAGTLVFDSVHPRWSYVGCDSNGFVIEAAEKKPISRLATAGFYFYNNAALFFNAAKQMILKDSHVDNAFYICPVFNEMILDGKKIKTIKIDRKNYHSFMTLEMVKQFHKID